MTQDKATARELPDPSPRPWKRSCFLIASASGEWVTHTGMGNLGPSRSSESEANADLIVRAVNAHDALVEALESVRDGYHADTCGAMLTKTAPCSCHVSIATAALALVEGETK